MLCGAKCGPSLVLRTSQGEHWIYESTCSAHVCRLAVTSGGRLDFLTRHRHPPISLQCFDTWQLLTNQVVILCGSMRFSIRSELTNAKPETGTLPPPVTSISPSKCAVRSSCAARFVAFNNANVLFEVVLQGFNCFTLPFWKVCPWA